MDMYIISNIIGVTGVVFILFAYLMIQTEKWRFDALAYSICNLCGALLIMFSLLYHWNLASFIIELAWSTISIVGIVRTFLRSNIAT